MNISAKSKILLSAILLISIITVIPTLACGINADAGTTGFNTLKIFYSARATALAQSMTGVQQTIDGLQFNPAAILSSPYTAISSTYMDYIIDTQGGSLRAVFPQDMYSAFGFYINYLNMGMMERTEINNNGDLIETGEQFGANNMIVGFSYARWLTDKVDLGGTIKAIYDNIDGNTATAIMIDAGIIHHPVNENIQVGLSLKNLGTQLSYYTNSKYKESLPLSFSAGMSYQLKTKLLLLLDLSKTQGQDVALKTGIEYNLFPAFVLRCGYRSDAGTWMTGGSNEWLSGISTGVGWTWKKYQLDYSFSSYGDLGLVNQLSLQYNF